MATERIQIVVTSKGVVTVRKDIESVGSSARRSASGVDMLRTALGGFTAGFVAKGLITTADAATRLNNMLKLTGQSGQELLATQESLYQTAMRNGQSVNELGGIYQKLVATQKNLGITGEGVMKMVDGIAAGMRLSTSSTAAQQGALQQLNQMLSNNTVQMQEVNSLLDGAYPLMQAAARGSAKFKGDVGALTNALRAGGYSTKQFFAELQYGLVETERQAASLPLTIGQAMTSLETAFQRWIATNDGVMTGASLLSSTIMLLANNLDTVMLVLTPVIAGLGLLAVRAAVVASAQGIGALISACAAAMPIIFSVGRAVLFLNAAILANPVVLIIAGFAALGVAIGAVAVHVMELMGVWDDFRTFAIDCINAVLKYVNKFLTFVTGSKWSLQIIDQGASAAITKAGKDAGAHMQDGVKTGGTSAATSLKNGVTAGGNNAGKTIDTSMTTGSIKIKDSIDKGALSFTDALWQTFKDIGAWFSSLFDEWFTSGAEKIKAANAGAGAGLSDQMKKGAAGAGDTLRKSVEEGGSSAAKQLNDSGNNNAKKIAQAGDAAGQSMASGLSTGGSSASSSIRSSLERGGDYAAQKIERAAKLVGDQLAETLTGIKGAQFLPGGGMTAPIGGYANGGQFRVGGSGGTDSQRVQFNATPNERVTVETPAQQRATDAAKAGASSGGSDTTLNVKAVTVFDPAAMIDALNTRAGQQAFIQFAKVNRDELQQILGVV